MADFALWVKAAEAGLGWPGGRFMPAYAGNRDEANALVVEASPFAAAVLTWTAERADWTGSANELRVALTGMVDERTAKLDDWPKTAKRAAGELRRLASNLRRLGVDCTFDLRAPGGNRTRLIRMVHTRDLSPSGGCHTGDGSDVRVGVPPKCSAAAAEEVVEWTG